MRILFVTRGFPPEGRWGSEGYAHDLALGLAAEGHEVEVFFPVPGGGSARVGQRSRPLGGIWIHPLELQRRPGKPFRDSYEDPRQDQALAELCERRGPFQRVHFTALGGEVSFGLVRAAKDHGAEVLVHLTEFLPWCHRGQLLDAELDDCTGPEPRKCAACVLRPGPWGRRGVVDRMRRVAQRVLFTLGERTALASPAAFALREVEVAAALARVDRFFAPSEAIGLRAVELRPAGRPGRGPAVRSGPSARPA
ncbi:MAG: glycosyltransferase [Planctomycetota bacterium]